MIIFGVLLIITHTHMCYFSFLAELTWYEEKQLLEALVSLHGGL